jgi:peptidyl-prolyl cis-trans isomerase D
MFDLFRSRDKMVRYLLSAFLLVVAFSMVGYLIPGYGGASTSTGNDNVLAEVGDEKVMTIEVQRAIQAGMRNRQMPPDMARFYAPQLVEQMINERVMEYQARKLGFKVTDAQIADAIREQIPQLFPEGKFVGNEQYAQMLAQQDLTIPEFERYVARQLMINRLRSMISESVVVTAKEVEDEYRKRNEKASIEYARIAPVTVKGDVSVSVDEMRDYFSKNRGNFTVPEKRSFKLAVFDPAKVEAKVTVPESALRRAYDQDKDRWRQSERVNVRHILLSTVDKSPEEEKKIREKAEGLLKQIKGGANFADLATKNSEDPGSGKNGGDLGWVVRGQTVPEFEKSAFSLKIGETSDLVKTQYGYHILRVEKREDAKVTPFEEAKLQLMNDVRKEMVAEQIAKTIDEAARELRRNPAQLTEIAGKYEMTIVDVQNIGRGDPVPEVGVNKDFDEIVFGLKKGEVSTPFQAPGDRQVIAVLTDIVAPRPAEFESVQDRIKNYLTDEKAKTLAKNRADELAKAVKANNGDVKKAAAALKVEVKTTPEFNRTGAVEGVGSADSVAQAFTSPVGSTFGPVQVGDAYIIGKVANRTPANMLEFVSAQNQIRDELRNKKVRERLMLFEDGLRRELENDKVVRLNQEAIKRLTNSYRG